jgi:O-antigen ligase
MKLLLSLLDYSFFAVLSFFLIISPFSRWYSKILIFTAFFIWLTLRIIRKDFSWRFPKPMLSALLAIAVVCCLATALSQDPSHSQKIVFNRYLPYLLAFIMGFDAVSRDSRRNLYWLTGAFLLSSAIVALGGVRDYLIFHPTRLFTAFGREIPFAMLPLFITYFFPFNAAIFAFCKNKVLRVFSGLNLAFLLPCVLWQGSRAAWIAISTGSLYVAVLKKIRVFLSLAVIFSVLIGAGLFAPGVREKLRSIPHPSQWNYRTPLFASAWKMFRNYPLAGAGVGMYEKLVKKPEYALPQDYPNPDKRLYLHPHSVYLEVMAETGVIGLAVFFYFFAAYFYLVFTFLRRINDRDTKAVVVAISSQVLAALIFGISGSIITVGVNETFIFWFLTGLSIGLMNNIKKQE